jgi:hypothetical protein
MNRMILNAVFAGSVALAGSAFAQSGATAQDRGANAPTPYEGPTSYGTTNAANQQAVRAGAASNTDTTGGSVQCGNSSAGSTQSQSQAGAASADATQSQTCITRQNDAIWNPSGVQDDHGQ